MDQSESNTREGIGITEEDLHQIEEFLQKAPFERDADDLRPEGGREGL